MLPKTFFARREIACPKFRTSRSPTIRSRSRSTIANLGQLRGSSPPSSVASFDVAASVGFALDALIEPHPIFPLIQRHAKVEDSEMYEVFNMAIGFCYVVDPAAAERTLAMLKQHGRVAPVADSLIEVGLQVSSDRWRPRPSIVIARTARHERPLRAGWIYEDRAARCR